jgi:hypothetical protein
MRESDIDRELRGLLTVDPSPEFLARVRARVAEPVEHGRTFWPALSALTVGAVVIGLVVVAISPRQTALVSAPLLAARSIGAGLSTMPLARADRVHSASLQTRDRISKKGTEPEVLISKAESGALQALVAAIADGRLDPASLPPDNPSVTDIVIPPITIPPLTASSNGEGVRQ